MKRIVAPIFLTVVAMTALIAGIYVLQSKKTELTFAEGVQDPKWPRMPITVHVAEDLAPWGSAIRGAANIWQGRTGCVRFQFVDYTAADIRIKSDDGNACDGPTADGKTEPASAHFCADGVDIVTRRLDDIREAGRIFLHEFGHALGLQHDRDGTMAVAYAVPQDGDPPEYLLPNDGDVKALRARYCR
jgi:hypothetical protein